jgi:hypothetical protein
MRRFLVLAMLVGLALAPASAVDAADGVHQMRAEFVTISTPPGPPIGAPDGFEDGWAIGASGSGTISTPVYSGEVTAVETHFSRWVAFDPTRTTGVLTAKVGGGVLTLTVADDPSSQLVIGFDGVFQFSGNFADPFGFYSHVVMRVEILSGSGVFAGATGHGHMIVTGNVIEEGVLVGSYVTR